MVPGAPAEDMGERRTESPRLGMPPAGECPSPKWAHGCGQKERVLGQVNVNPGGSSGDGGFGAGMIIGIIVLILIVLVLVFYAGPLIFNVNTNTRSLADLFLAA